MEPRAALKAQRRVQGFSQESLAEALNVSVGAVRDWEQGRRHPQPDTRQALAVALDVSLPDLALMLDGRTPPPRTNGQELVPGWLNIFAGLEQTAVTFRGYEPTVLPGLLQTPAYAEAILRSDPTERTDEDIARLVQLRLDRQAVLTRTPVPLHLDVVVDEVALRRVAGSPRAMGDQLDHLVAVGTLRNVDLHVLPFSAGAHSIGFGAFVILGFPWGAETTYLENRASAMYQEEPHQVAAHGAVFAHLSRLALSPAESVEFIRAVRETYR